MQVITTKYGLEYRNDCIAIEKDEFRERNISTNMRSDFEKNILQDLLPNAQKNIETNILNRLSESIIVSQNMSGYKVVKACLKIMNNEFKECRRIMSTKNNEEQNVIGNLITSTEIELEKKVKVILTESILDLTFKLIDTGAEMTIKDFFNNIIDTLEKDGEGYDKNKSPFENKYPDIISGFDKGLMICLINNGVIEGNEDGTIEEVNSPAAKEFLIANIIKPVFKNI